MRKPHIFATIVVAVCLFLVLCYSSSVGALDENEFFETARGQLLQFYSSEIMAHSGLIIGLVIGLFALLAEWSDFTKNGDTIKKCIFFLLVGLAVSLSFYSVGRLFYWSYVSTNILQAKMESCPFDNSTATSLIGWLNINATTNFSKTTSFECNFARAFYFDTGDCRELAFIAKMSCVMLLPLVVWFALPKTQICKTEDKKAIATWLRRIAPALALLMIVIIVISVWFA